MQNLQPLAALTERRLPPVFRNGAHRRFGETPYDASNVDCEFGRGPALRQRHARENHDVQPGVGGIEESAAELAPGADRKISQGEQHVQAKSLPGHRPHRFASSSRELASEGRPRDATIERHSLLRLDDT